MLNIKTCPTCGSKRIRKVRKTVHTSRTGRDIAVPAVTFYECPNCGEKLYDHQAMQKLEAYARRLRPTG